MGLSEEEAETEDIVTTPTSTQDSRHQENQELLIGTTSVKSGGEKVNSCSSLSQKWSKNNNGGVESHFTGTTTATAGGSGGGGANNSSNSTRRIFTPAFKQTVLEAFISDPDCIGNQRATARKFGIHRRQVQKWLTQLEKEGEGSSSSSEQLLNPEGSSGSTSWILGTSGGSSSSSSEKERGGEVEEPVQEPVAKDPQVDLSPSSSSSNSSKRLVDLCNMSSAAMAMSLNLTLNSGTSANAIPNTLSSLPNKLSQINHFERSRNNSSPTPALATPSSIPSPNSLFSRFYGIYTHGQGQGHHGSTSPATTYAKYQGKNLNGDLAKGIGTSSLSIPTLSSKLPHPQRSHSRHPRMSENLGIGTNPYYLHILDEIATARPHDDYSLLRQALLRNEVSFTKVPPSTPKSTFFPPHRSPEEIHTWGNSGKGETSRTNSPAPVSPSKHSTPQSQNILALELLRQQNEYMRLFQQSGLNFSDLSPDAAKSSTTNPKYPWLHPLAQAASIGFPFMGAPPPNEPKKQSPPPHVFVSPKPPNNSKPKTVAAALAASRISPNSLLSAFTATGAFDSGSMVKKRSTGSRKRGKPKQNTKPCCPITRPSMEDDYLDPTLMLEVSTSISDATNSNSANGLPYQHSVNGVGTHFLHSILQASERETLGNRLESPECPEIRKYFEQSERRSPAVGSEPDAEQITKTMVLDAFSYDPDVAGDCRAVARKFGLNVRLVMKWIKETPTKTTHQPSTNSLYENYGLKLPINGNPDVNNPELDMPNHREQLPNPNGDLNDEESVRMHPRHQTPIPFQTSSNKRKNSKPNQICDFQQEEDDDLMMFGDVPMDMMIPIKKRRVSSQE